MNDSVRRVLSESQLSWGEVAWWSGMGVVAESLVLLFASYNKNGDCASCARSDSRVVGRGMRAGGTCMSSDSVAGWDWWRFGSSGEVSESEVKEGVKRDSWVHFSCTRFRSSLPSGRGGAEGPQLLSAVQVWPSDWSEEEKGKQWSQGLAKDKNLRGAVSGVNECFWKPSSYSFYFFINISWPLKHFIWIS